MTTDPDTEGQDVAPAGGAAGAEPGGSAAPEESPAPASIDSERSSRFWRTAPWVLAILSLLVAAFSTFQWLDLRADEQTRAAVQAAATDFVLTLTTWDATDGLDDTVEQLRQAGSEQFLQEIDTLFGGSLREDLEQAEAVSSGEIQDVFVQSIDEREAVVFAVVIQEIELRTSNEPASLVRSARISLRQDGDRWLVTRVELVNDSGLAPSATSEEGS